MHRLSFTSVSIALSIAVGLNVQFARAEMPAVAPPVVPVQAAPATAEPVAPSAQPAAPVAPSAQPVVPPDHPLSWQAQEAARAAKTFAETDPLLTRLESLSTPDWNSKPLEVFVNTGKDFGTIAGAALPTPGGASEALLQEFGCTHALIKEFNRTQRRVQLAVYTFYRPEGAYGAYSCLRKGASTVVVRGGASSETDNSISFWKGRRFVVITSFTEDDELAKALVSSVADQVVASIGGESYSPAMLNRLSILDRVSGSEKLFFGTLAARRFGNMPDVQGLEVDRSVGAAFAEYQFPPPWSERMRALVIEYGNPEMARSIYNRYSDGVINEHKKCLLQPDSVLCKANNSYLYCAIRGSRVAVINGARRKESATMLARQLAY